MQVAIALVVLMAGATANIAQAADSPPLKQAAVLYPAHLITKARRNIERYDWAKDIARPIVEAAQPWMKMSDDELWDLMFSNGIKRSWMVWSNGHCPSCRKSVPMYTWKMDALKHPWKTQCPHCDEFFPKNDFHAFYRSGLDEHGVFQPARADRSLLFNAEHPGKDDPMRTFGVDDGEGYVDGEKRWRFIGAYLIFGQWKQAIVAGVRNLAAAYAVTGDSTYAHKAGVLLDRVADLYPTFDFGKEGVMYEGPPRDGYISTWHDACVEVRELAIAYDQVFETLREDGKLVRFLADKARRYKLSNPKESFADVQRNIEERIFRDTVAHRQKIESNYPQTDITMVMLKTVLEWPGNRPEVMTLIEEIVRKSTAVDGMTGEKGLAGYTRLAPNSLAELLGLYTRVDPMFLKDLLQRYPRLHETYRFHIDTWCLDRYYPEIGDTGAFARPVEQYAGVSFSKNPGLGPSAAGFLWELYEQTRDAAFVKVLYRSNGNRVEGLPYDLLADDPAAFQQQVRSVIEREGTDLNLRSVNKQQWHLAVLRSGVGPDTRAVWIDYDSGERHGHADAMNLGLFARGLDLMPDFGYPPVQFGGWGAPRAVWYTLTAAHNTVMVDGQNTRSGGGKTTLWAEGKRFRAIRASAPALIGGQQYERTIAMVDLSEQDFYVLDIFRVVGGTDHIKFMRSHFGSISTLGLDLTSAGPPPTVTTAMHMRSFQRDEQPEPVWSVDWRIEDLYKLLPPDSRVGLRYIDLTAGATVFTAESWVNTTLFSGDQDAWIPTILVHRRAETAPLASAFVSVIEPHGGSSSITAVRRLAVTAAQSEVPGDADVAVEVELKDGRRDLWMAADVEDPLKRRPERRNSTLLVQKDHRFESDGELGWVRLDANGRIQRAALCRGAALRVAESSVRLKGSVDFVEMRLEGDQASVEGGAAEGIEVRRAARE